MSIGILYHLTRRPANYVPFQQEALIKQLQEQHYQQYMAQVYAQHAQQAQVLLVHSSNPSSHYHPESLVVLKNGSLEEIHTIR